ncbi:MAG: hypothetical protein IT305_13310 [Chloroflexi bacterium]|nr:hypothetical protein [Chloroflexota bacterium]
MQERQAPLPSKPIHCRVCTILIGQGYEERRPIPLTHGRGYVCGQCYASIRRQTLRRAAEREAEAQQQNTSACSLPNGR